ncbi:bifunctional pyr operon transcriptional regulator/uracil phosphoribosyltransferase PyrR [Marivirga atlantica]|jgi:pyrimidine operon attenuation protein/uracil phosphoribosyltransferase|uniref:Bifunctional protein PyrR n=1 Tax=Marivirga atlantica TaxID=1548457 RepID=A0A937AF10_9BACT|nr:bifunctional pyr operon transcriptional regulator/uracil phosphoribosyltransferase PyrR [Marivirga atlantica]MBL0765038.1 bifunctional pyr operon transcriptional regulator/uracil phosphoribosyltransferase PyrR [Marivirga atlantica]
MDKRLILDSELLRITIFRLVEELIENHGDFTDTVLIGMQPRGIYLADRLHKRLEERLESSIPLGYLDVTFYRDDFRRRDSPIEANATDIPFLIEDKKVILIDDVLFTGRTTRAALDAMIAFGRPRLVELLTFIDRKYTRDLPIQPDYVGKRVNTLKTQRVLVEWTDQGAENDQIWLVTND